MKKSFNQVAKPMKLVAVVALSAGMLSGAVVVAPLPWLPLWSHQLPTYCPQG